MNPLLAEDDAVLSDALSALLRAVSFAVAHAPNGALAEFLPLKQAFDLTGLEVGPPMVDGLTVLKRVRLDKPDLPGLVLTAADSLASRVAGRNTGADDFLTKPFNFPELEARLRALLRRASIAGEQLDQRPREWMLLEWQLGQVTTAWGCEPSGAASPDAINVYFHRHACAAPAAPAQCP